MVHHEHFANVTGLHKFCLKVHLYLASSLTQLDEYFNSSIHHCVGTAEQLDDACNPVDVEHYSSVAFHIVVGAGTVVCGWA